MGITHAARTMRLAALVAGSLAVGSAAHAQCQLQKLTGATTALGDNFGRRVATSGDLLAVAAPLHAGPGGAASGAVYVYRLEAGAWVQEQEITPADGAANDQFGFWIAMDAGLLLIGAKFDDDLGTDAGSAYVFRRDGTAWVQEQKLFPGDGVAGDNFGNSVALAADVAVIGSPTHDLPVTDCGAAYVFRRSPAGVWSQQFKLTADDGRAGDQLGFTVALHGSRALAGAWMADFATTVLDVGAAYVFRNDGNIWAQEARLDPADGLAADRFAVGLALSDDLAVVGADLADPGGLASAGAAYIYRRTGTSWAQEDKLIASDGLAGDQFGFSSAADGTTILTTAVNADTPTVLNVGAVYAYRRVAGTWTFRGRFTSSDGEAGDLFGAHVVFSGSHAVVGARQDDDLGTDSGSAYVFAWPTCVCYPDCSGDNQLTIADFGCFQSKFAGSSSYADCNGDSLLTIADFGCFQAKFVAGCP